MEGTRDGDPADPADDTAKFKADLVRDLEDDARRYDARAAALESDAQEFRRKAMHARLGADYVRKSTATGT